jgi:hypothetical protein
MLFMRDIKRYPEARIREHPIKTFFGPILSVNLPASGPVMPRIIIPKVKAPEILVLDQPNSHSNGSRKTPKERLAPHANDMIENAAASTTYP